MNIVIVGNSTSAIAAVEAIRKRDMDSGITLVSCEPHHTYGRPLISYLLCGKTNPERIQYRPADFYERHRVQTKLGLSVTAIDAKAKEITLENGEALPFDKLLIATGASPVTPDIPGLETVKTRFCFTTLDDAEALRQAVDGNTRVLILGAGLIGLKCAEGLHAITQHITVTDRAPQVLPSVLCPQAAEIIGQHIASQGISLVLSDAAEAFTPNAARLRSGREIPFDVLVIAVGVRPNVDLVARAGGKAKHGILTDAFGRTSLPGIYAAGDCTESMDACSGQRKVMALLPNAYMQGECAGTHMAGGNPEPPRLMPMNALSLWGKHIVSAGSLVGEIHTQDTGDGMRIFARQEDRLQGFLLIGDVARAGIYTAMVRDKTPLPSVDCALLYDRPSLAIFDVTQRKKMLGGEGA